MSDESVVVVPEPARVAAGLAQFATGDGQRKMIALAEEFAAVCAKRAELAKAEQARPWIIQIGPGKHAVIEAWQYLGQRVGVIARTVETREIRHPVTGEFEGTWAAAEACYQGQPVGRAEQVCMADEVLEKRGGGEFHRRWVGPNGAPLRHAMLGMAQTRAQSRVLASVLRFIAVLSGVEGTPAEEMDGVTPRGNGDGKPPIQPPARKSAAKPAEANPNVVVGIVDDIQVASSKPGAAKPWTRWGIGIGGTYYGTFSESVAKLAQNALDFATPVRLTWTKTGEHLNVVDLALAPETAKAAPAREPGVDDEPPAADGMNL